MNVSVWTCSLRLAAVGPGPHGSLCGLLLYLLPGFPGPAHHHVYRRTLLLHRLLPGLRRCFPHSFIYPCKLKCDSICFIKNVWTWWYEIMWAKTCSHSCRFHRLCRLPHLHLPQKGDPTWHQRPEQRTLWLLLHPGVAVRPSAPGQRAPVHPPAQEAVRRDEIS